MSAADGLILFERRPSSFKAQHFSEFMNRLGTKLVGRPVTVLLDNCSIHRAHVTTEVLVRQEIGVLWNVPHRPDLNGIEFVWAIAKRRFK